MLEMSGVMAGKKNREGSRHAGGVSKNRNTKDRNIKNRRYKRGYRRRRKRIRIFTCAKALTLIFLVVILFVTIKERFLTGTTDSDLYLSGNGKGNISAENLDGLYSPYAVLMDLSDDRIIAEHNSEERMYPASLTKIMTALLAAENTENMEEVITMPASVFDRLYAEGASMAGFQPGEEVKLKDVLYGILLPSGAECCVVFAERIAGSEEAFAEMMNQKAEKLGMRQTHFCNSTGLQDENHYSTARDMAVLLNYALKNAVFRDAFVSETYHSEPTERHLEGLAFQSTMFRALEGLGNREIPGGAILGGKTGYTEEAGLCLASLAEVEGREYILVTAGAEGSHNTKPYHVIDAIAVYQKLY